MSGTYPTTPIFSTIGFRSVNYNLSSQSISGRTQVRNIGGQRFEFSAQYTRMTRSEFAPILVFTMAQRGSAETFTIVLPQISSKSGDASGTILVNGAADIGATTVGVDGVTGTLKAGDMVKFANHSKVYMLTADRAGYAGGGEAEDAKVI